MKVSREQAAKNRERILAVAARLMRERGIDGIGVADLMKAAGLTHGGFYGHFESKEDLATQACARGVERAVQYWEQAIGRAPDKPLDAVLGFYLSMEHRDNPGHGCLLPALAADAAHRDTGLRSVFETAIRSLSGLLARLLPGRSPAQKRQRALATLAGMVGALALARAVEDRSLAEEILAAVAGSATDWAD